MTGIGQCQFLRGKTEGCPPSGPRSRSGCEPRHLGKLGHSKRLGSLKSSWEHPSCTKTSCSLWLTWGGSWRPGKKEKESLGALPFPDCALPACKLKHKALAPCQKGEAKRGNRGLPPAETQITRFKFVLYRGHRSTGKGLPCDPFLVFVYF